MMCSYSCWWYGGPEAEDTEGWWVNAKLLKHSLSVGNLPYEFYYDAVPGMTRCPALWHDASETVPCQGSARRQTVGGGGGGGGQGRLAVAGYADLGHLTCSLAQGFIG